MPHDHDENDTTLDDLLDLHERFGVVEKKMASAASVAQVDALKDTFLAEHNKMWTEIGKARDAAEGPPPVFDQAAADRALRAAFVRATSELRVLNKDRMVEVVSTRTGGKYKFRYSTFAELMDELRPALARHGLSIFQEPIISETSCTISTTIFHVDGGVLSPRPLVLPLTSRSPQDIGIVISYGRRYHAQTIFGLASTEDPELEEKEGGAGERFEHRNEQATSTPLERSQKSKTQHGLALRGAKNWDELRRASHDVANDKTLNTEDKGDLLKVWQARKTELEAEDAKPKAEAKPDPKTEAVATQFEKDAAAASAGKEPSGRQRNLLDEPGSRG